MKKDKKVIVIGSGFAGLSAACFMAKSGADVLVLEKHSIPGGRARQLKAQGFTFDMGPSWYWMPDVFERFFNQFGKTVSDYYKLKRIDPSYRIYWQDELMDVPADYNDLRELFNKTEPGSGKKLDQFLEQAEYKYKVGMQELVFKPGKSLAEFLHLRVLKGLIKLDILSSLKKHVAAFFENEKLKQLLEFPVLFLGAMPEKIPALYSLMNYADIKGGTWYPIGGIYCVVDAMYRLAAELGVQFHFEENVTGFNFRNNEITEVITWQAKNRSDEKKYAADVVIGAADYHFIESSLLPAAYRSYSNKYWDKRVMAPSCLLYYVGLNKKLKNLSHHSLFFDASFENHAKEIYETKQWPGDPLFYVSATSVTDNSVAPEGCENLFFLVPVAAGVKNDTNELREKYFDIVLKRFETKIKQNIKENIVFKKSFGPDDFVSEYNAFKGNAYGLANTLRQTAILKPSCKSEKVKNLFYAGQLTVPGPGVPPSIISGEVVAKEIFKTF